MRHVIRIAITTCLIGTITIAIILWGRGYRFDTKGNSLVSPTGSLVATSDPNGAQVFINGKFKLATNSSLQLPPGDYKIRISKQGFIPWEKQIKVLGEVVAKADALLLPTNPSLSPLTSTGILNPIVSPDGSRIAFVRDEEASTSAESTLTTSPEGVWVLELVNRPLGLNRDPKQVAKSIPGRNFSQAQLSWSPDGKQLLATFSSSSKKSPIITGAYLLETDRLNTAALDVSATLNTLLSSWEEQKKIKDQEKILGLPNEIVPIATSSMRIIAFSPDETKLLYEASSSAQFPLAIKPPLIGTNPTMEERAIKPGHLYVYDSKEDKNFPILSSSPLSPSSALQWYPDSRHLVVTAADKHIAIMEYDGGNKTTVYAGPFLDNFVALWPAGGKLIILTTLNPFASTRPNLYLVNLR